MVHCLVRPPGLTIPCTVKRISLDLFSLDAEMESWTPALWPFLRCGAPCQRQWQQPVATVDRMTHCGDLRQKDVFAQRDVAFSACWRPIEVRNDLREIGKPTVDTPQITHHSHIFRAVQVHRVRRESVTKKWRVSLFTWNLRLVISHS